MPLSLKTMEVQIKEDQWNKRFRTVQVYWIRRLLNFRVRMFVKSAVTEKPSGMGDSCTQISVEVIFGKKYQKVSNVWMVAWENSRHFTTPPMVSRSIFFLYMHGRWSTFALKCGSLFRHATGQFEKLTELKNNWDQPRYVSLPVGLFLCNLARAQATLGSLCSPNFFFAQLHLGACSQVKYPRQMNPASYVG